MLKELLLSLFLATFKVVSCYRVPIQEYEFNRDSNSPTNKYIHEDISTNYATIMVGKDGNAKFNSVQTAINSLTPNNQNWVRIYIKAGLYIEHVNIPEWKPRILLQGEGLYQTQIIWSEYNDIKKPTFQASAQNFVAMDIGFVNSYNYPTIENKNIIVPAVAAMIEGDMSTFYRCRFFGLQDTFWDVQGRHYYESCTIVGAIDFIFGDGQSIFQGCSLIVTELPLGYVGYITAQGRSDPKGKSGFVLKSCEVKGRLVHLGRAWGPFARVVFYESEFDTEIAKPRWDAWFFPHNWEDMTFEELYCHGKGAISGRWGNKKGMNHLESLDFIEAKEWLGYQPKP